MESTLFGLLFLMVMLLVMFAPLIILVIKDDKHAFIRVHYPNTKDKDLPKKFQDIDRNRRLKN